MSGVSAGQRAVELPWLRPSDEALLALTADPPDRTAVLRDPVLFAHVLRFTHPTPGPADDPPGGLEQPGLCQAAATLLATAPAYHEPPLHVFRVAHAAGEIASALASDLGDVPADLAGGVARLTPLGWYGVSAVDPEAAGRAVEEIVDGGDPSVVQRRLWGLDAAAIGRRLAARWRLPDWLVGTIGFLNLSAGDAARVAAPWGLFRVVRASVAAAEKRRGTLGLVRGCETERDGLLERALDLARTLFPTDGPLPQRSVPIPVDVLVHLLRTTVKARRGGGAVWLADAERRIDGLADGLAALRAEWEVRVRDAKLASMAEFAAGASHEINNPLAVISGHAQMLLANEDDPGRRAQLGAIVRQTRRVHELLQGTLQFARPAKPSPIAVRLGEWLREVTDAHRPDADAKGVALEADDSRSFGAVTWGDAGQLRQVLAQLIRNAIEAAPPGGFVRVAIEPRGSGWAVVVEDSGPGPAPRQVEHLFDPFYSGRTAGRGTGLGLAIAWRLAQANGGDVRYEPSPGGPTRFVLHLPPHILTASGQPERKSA